MDCKHDDYKGACKQESCPRCGPRIASIRRVLSEGISSALYLRLRARG